MKQVALLTLTVLVLAACLPPATPSPRPIFAAQTPQIPSITPTPQVVKSPEGGNQTIAPTNARVQTRFPEAMISFTPDTSRLSDGGLSAAWTKHISGESVTDLTDADIRYLVGFGTSISSFLTTNQLDITIYAWTMPLNRQLLDQWESSGNSSQEPPVWYLVDNQTGRKYAIFLSNDGTMIMVVINSTAVSFDRLPGSDKIALITKGTGINSSTGLTQADLAWSTSAGMFVDVSLLPLGYDITSHISQISSQLKDFALARYEQDKADRISLIPTVDGSGKLIISFKVETGATTVLWVMDSKGNFVHPETTAGQRVLLKSDGSFWVQTLDANAKWIDAGRFDPENPKMLITVDFNRPGIVFFYGNYKSGNIDLGWAEGKWHTTSKVGGDMAVIEDPTNSKDANGDPRRKVLKVWATGDAVHPNWDSVNYWRDINTNFTVHDPYENISGAVRLELDVYVPQAFDGGLFSTHRFNKSTGDGNSNSGFELHKDGTIWYAIKDPQYGKDVRVQLQPGLFKVGQWNTLAIEIENPVNGKALVYPIINRKIALKPGDVITYSVDPDAYYGTVGDAHGGIISATSTPIDGLSNPGIYVLNDRLVVTRLSK